MSKLTKFIKNNIKLFVGIIIGGILFGGATYVIATEIASGSVTYTSNGQTTVEGALNDLYQKADVLKKINYYQYWRSTSSQDPGYVPSQVYPSYTSIVTNNTTSTLVRTLYSNGSPTTHGACLYYGTSNKIFCIDQGYWTAGGASADSVKTVLQLAMSSALGVSSSNISCSSTSSYVYCSVGSAKIYAYTNNGVRSDDGSKYCNITRSGVASCT